MTLKGVDLSSTERKKSAVDPLAIFLIIIVLCSAGGFWYHGKTFEQTIALKEKEIESIKLKIADIDQKIPEISKIRDEVENLKAQIQWVDNITKDPFKYRALLTQFAKLIPDNVTINNLSVKSGVITFSGKAVEEPNVPALTTVAYFIKLLQDSKYFGMVTITGVSGEAGANKLTNAYSFNMDVPYNNQEVLNSIGGGEAR